MFFIDSVSAAGYYASSPGIGAGTTQGFSVAVAVASLATPADGQTKGLLSNFSNPAGWLITYQEQALGGTVVFTVDIGRDDGSVLSVSSDPLSSWKLQFAIIGLSIGAGADASVQLTANGVPVIDTTLDPVGGALSFVPAAGTPLELGAPTNSPDTGNLSFLGAGFSSDIFDPDDFQQIAAYAYTNGRLAPMVGSFGSVLGGTASFVHAWDTQSLLKSGLRTNAVARASAGDIWSPVPDTSTQTLTLQGSGPSPILLNANVAPWAPAILPVA